MTASDAPIDPARLDHPAVALARLAEEAGGGGKASQPVAATALGDRRFDDRLRPNGRGAIAADVDRATDLIRRAEALDPNALDARDRVTREALIEHLGFERDVVVAGTEAWAVDPLDGPHVTFLNIPSFQPIRDAAEATTLVARWREMAPWLDRHVASSQEALARGVAAPAALVRSV